MKPLRFPSHLPRRGRRAPAVAGLALAAILSLGAPLSSASAGPAVPPTTIVVKGNFDDVSFDLRNGITNAGLVLEAVNNVGEMLERTKADVGATRTIYLHAEIYSFCSAEVSRAVMEADPNNLQYCPYKIFAYERPEAPGEIVVGHPTYPDGVTEKVNQMIDGIIKDAFAGR